MTRHIRWDALGPRHRVYRYLEEHPHLAVSHQTVPPQGRMRSYCALCGELVPYAGPCKAREDQ